MFCNDASTALTNFENVLTDNGESVVDKKVFEQSKTNEDMTVYLQTLSTPDVREAEIGVLFIGLHYRHEYTTEKDLFGRLDEIESYFKGYSDNGIGVGIKLQTVENFREDSEAYQSIAVMDFQIILN